MRMHHVAHVPNCSGMMQVQHHSPRPARQTDPSNPWPWETECMEKEKREQVRPTQPHSLCMTGLQSDRRVVWLESERPRKRGDGGEGYALW